MDFSRLVRHLDYGRLKSKILPRGTLLKTGKIRLPVSDPEKIWTLLRLLIRANNPSQLDLYSQKLDSVLREVKPVQTQLNYSQDQIRTQVLFKTERTIYSVLFRYQDRTSLILQLLAAYHIERSYPESRVDSIGVVVPDRVSPKLISDYLGDWDSTEYWKEVLRSKEAEKNRSQLYQGDLVAQFKIASLLSSQIGYTINLTSLKILGELPQTTHQIFLRSNRLPSSSQTYSKNLYLHAHYFNISKPHSTFFSSMIRAFDISQILSSRGVVVHVGRKTGMSQEEALNQMKLNLIRLSELASPNHRLLIETPAGQKNELLSRVEDFISFWKELPVETREVSGICLDTCHVFASGYQPTYYLHQLEKEQLPVELVHFNDSYYPRGRRVDRHATIGSGFIGLEELSQIATWCDQNKVSAVRE